MLSPEQLKEFERNGHLTVEGMFTEEEMRNAIDDAHIWGEEFLAGMNKEEKKWYIDANAEKNPLRKLDNPVYHREIYGGLARNPQLVKGVEQLIGPGVKVFFSQIFFKPPEGGGPKPIHQDNYYFDPDLEDGMLTAWIALDDATVENGCLYYGNGSQREPILEHVAPPEEPFNLQVPQEIAAGYEMTPAPVSQGGVSFHHGRTLHQSSSNTSPHFRRAVAIHYLRKDARLVNPKLDFDPTVEVPLCDIV